MVFMVDMYRRTSGDPVVYSFLQWFWGDFRAIALAYGWSPRGTSPTVGTAANYYSGSDRYWAASGNFTGDYQPEDICYEKMVSADDARNWADALERARDDNFPQLEAIDTSVVDNFIAFLRAGEFAFHYDD